VATNAENIATRIAAITTELAAGDHKPSYTLGPKTVDWQTYWASLTDELSKLLDIQARIGGTFIVKERRR
jgi:hypothetical protein